MATDVANPQVFRSSFWRGVALIWVPILGFTIWDVANRGWPATGWAALAVMGTVTVLVYAVGWRPAVVAGTDSVVVRNPFRTTTIPWSSITGIDLTDALRFHTDKGMTRAWSVDRGGAASNMLRGMGSKRLPAQGVEKSAMEAMARRSPGDFAVASLIDTWRQRRDQSRGSVQVTWAWPILGAFLVLLALSVVLIAT